MPPPAQSMKTEEFYDQTELREANFNSCVINMGIIQQCTITGNVLGVGEAGLLAGEAPPASPVDRILHTHTHTVLSFLLSNLPSLQVHDQTVEVFENPDVIMTKFIQTIIDKVVQVST